MVAGYSFSGWMKLQSPSWIDGSAVLHVLIIRPARCGPARDFLLALPASLLQPMTWGCLAAELHPSTEFLASSQNHYLVRTRSHKHCDSFVVNFTDLTVGMLMIHLFTWNPGWFFATQIHQSIRNESLSLVPEHT